MEKLPVILITHSTNFRSDVAFHLMHTVNSGTKVDSLLLINVAGVLGMEPKLSRALWRATDERTEVELCPTFG